jgi:hypothetical protein
MSGDRSSHHHYAFRYGMVGINFSFSRLEPLSPPLSTLRSRQSGGKIRDFAFLAS